MAYVKLFASMANSIDILAVLRILLDATTTLVLLELCVMLEASSFVAVAVGVVVGSIMDCVVTGSVTPVGSTTDVDVVALVDCSSFVGVVVVS